MDRLDADDRGAEERAPTDDVTLRAAQTAPEGRWRVWLFMGGRGAGKTRAGAEWIRRLVRDGEATRIALVGSTLGDVREVMIEGPSGLRTISPDCERPDYVVSRRKLAWPNGSVGYAFSAEDPDSLRGPQFDAAWCDEIGAWKQGDKVWDMLMFALRLGEAPRATATSTPRPTKLVKELLRRHEQGAGAVVMTRSRTQDNAENLSPHFIASVEDTYADTLLGRQELDGELVEDSAGALWTRSIIEDARVALDVDAIRFERVVVAVDPPAMAGPESNACGIVAVGLKDDVAYVVADATARGLRPTDWAGRVAALARRLGAGLVIAEGNQGGEMVREVLEMAGVGPRHGVRVDLLHASKSKRDRALPVSYLYEKKKVKHVGAFRELEDEMCTFGTADQGGSPDRLDAMVWAVQEVLSKPKAGPGVVSL